MVAEVVDKESQEKKLKNVAKKSLHKMQKNRKRHVIRTKGRVIKYGAKSFGRNIWLSAASTVVMVITLVILFATIVASVVLSNTAQMMKDKIDITIYLKPNTSEQVLTELTNTLKADSNIKSVETSTSEDEYAKFLADSSDSDEILGILDEEMEQMMISKMQATMRIKVYNVDNLDSIKNIVETDQLFVKYLDKDKSPTYDVNQTEIATITSWANIARTGGMILAAVFLVVSVLVIFSTIRMAIFSRREEIYMMKLVGAEKNFIRGPFLIEAEICGIIAGLIAAGISYFGFEFLAPRLMEYGINMDNIGQILSSNQLILVVLAFVLAGVLIGRISARFAVSKYLNKA